MEHWSEQEWLESYVSPQKIDALSNEMLVDISLEVDIIVSLGSYEYMPVVILNLARLELDKVVSSKKVMMLLVYLL